MKKFKIFTIAMLLATTTTTLNSCGGDEKKEEDKKDEKKVENTTESNTESENTDDIDYTSEADGVDGVGDFYGLKKDLTDLFITNIKNGNIVLGKTTKSEMVNIIGGENFDKKYDGLRVSGYVTYTEDDVVSSITLDYFYDTESALSLLDIDKEDITASISEYLGVEGVAEGDYTDAPTNWSFNNQTISQSNFDDGYTIEINNY